MRLSSVIELNINLLGRLGETFTGNDDEGAQRSFRLAEVYNINGRWVVSFREVIDGKRGELYHINPDGQSLVLAPDVPPF